MEVSGFKIDNALTQMRKGFLEYCILLQIGLEPVYSSELIDKLKTAGLTVVEGTLYPLLNRLHKGGLLSHEWREHNAGPPRKYYTLTADGKVALGELDNCWKELAQTVEKINQSLQNQEDGNNA